MVVDAHHHFWDPTRRSYPWMGEELRPLRRPFGPDDLRPLLAASGVDRTVLVQTLPDEGETLELLAVADRSDFVAGVVGWVDLTAPDVATRLERLRAAPGGRKLVGIRHQAHDEPDPAWLARSDVRRGVAAVCEASLAYDLLVRTRELPSALALARGLPEVRFVVDHLAKPPIRDGGGRSEAWYAGVKALAALPNVTCKLSGLVTEADPASWTVADLVPYVRRALDVFGPARLLFGSDWPVCLVAASYERVVEAYREALADLSEAEHGAIFGSNAAAVYRLAVTARAGTA